MVRVPSGKTLRDAAGGQLGDKEVQLMVPDPFYVQGADAGKHELSEPVS